MKVFLFGYFEKPTGMAPVKRTLCLAKGLVAAGAEVEIDVIHWFFQGAQIVDFPAEGEEDGVKYCFVNGKKNYRNGIELRLDLKWRDRRGAVQYVLTHVNEGDVVYIYSGNSCDIQALAAAAHRRNAKAVLELVEIPYYGDDLKSRLFRWIQGRYLFPKLDGFTCISEELVKYARAHASKTALITKIPIMVEPRKTTLQGSGLSVPYIVHTGTMLERKDGISTILKAFAEAKKSDRSGCKLVFAGPHSNERCAFIPLMEKLGIREDVILAGMIKDAHRLCSLQQHAAMSIVYRYDNLQTRCGFSTKMGEILASGVPLITTPVGGQREYLENGKNAFVVEPGNVAQLAETIEYILTHHEQAKAVGAAGKELADEVFSPKCQGKRLSEFFIEMIKRR